jgi:hypothetical protein
LRFALALGVAFAAVAIAVVLVLRRPPFFAERAPTPTFRMATSEGAAWRPLSESATLQLLVERGRVELEVDKLRQGQRFLLELPDGELEVQGTRFMVDVDGVRTNAVRVMEGRVALRLRGRAEIVLVGGENWSERSAVPSPSASSTPSTKPVLPSSESTLPSGAATTAGGPRTQTKAPPIESPRARHAARRERGAMDGGESASADSSAGGAPATSASDFAQAMSAFSAGDYGRAEHLLFGFERDHQEDTRAEDAMFLRAVARSRRGDAVGAQTIAREYLRRYPNGLRRSEAERLAR